MDWGDFGGDDFAPQACDVCDARPSVAESLRGES